MRGDGAPGGTPARPGVLRGRGATDNPPNRFERLHVEPVEAWTHADDPAPRTRLYRDATRTILSHNDSPDVAFEVSINPYRGCEHGCAYCYARPSHEYLGFSAGLDFETRIVVKEDAPTLLRDALLSPGWRPRTIGMSGVTDPYQPVERRLAITRGCLEVLAEFLNPVSIITKSHMVTRDIDLLTTLSAVDAAAVAVSLTTLRNEVQRALEPRAASPARRLDAIGRLADAGIRTRVMVAPVIPGLTDEEIPAIVDAAAEAGATGAGWIMMRLPHGVKQLFSDWLEGHFPDRRSRVLNRVREVRGGELNDPRFGTRMAGEGPYADQIRQLFEAARRRAGLDGEAWSLSADAFRRPPRAQLTLFD